MRRIWVATLFIVSSLFTLSATVAFAQDSNKPQQTAAGQSSIVLFSGRNFTGQSRTLTGNLDTLDRETFNDRARSVRINGGVWVLCKDRAFRGRCEFVYESISDLRRIRMSEEVTSVYVAPISYTPSERAIVLFNRDDFEGRYVGFDQGVDRLSSADFNDVAESIQINRGVWLVCVDARYDGQCEVLDRSVRNLDSVGLGDKISSIRPYVDDRRGSTGFGNRYGGGYDHYAAAGAFEGEHAVFFPAPRLNGTRISACTSSGRCGAYAAERFCREAGFDGVGYSAVGGPARRSVSPRGERVCTNGRCPVLSDVVCVD